MGRGAKGLLAAGIAVVVIAGGAVAAEFIARDLTVQGVRDAIRQQLPAVADRADIEVHGIVIPQLIAGRLDEVDLAAADIDVDGLSLDASVRAFGLPTREGSDTSESSATGTLTLDEADVTTLLSQAGEPVSSWPNPQVELTDGRGQVSTSLQLPLVGAVPLVIGADVDAAGGNLELIPQDASIGDLTFTREQAAQAPVDLSFLTAPIVVCAADTLPAGIAITGAAVTDGAIVVDVSASSEVFTPTATADWSACG